MTDSITAVAFDIDGTLYANWRLNIRIVPYFIHNLRFFLKYNSVRKILHRTGPLPDFYAYQAILLAERTGMTAEEARSLICDKVYKGLEPYFERVTPYPHVYETFELFKKAGLKIGLLSDFPPDQKGDVWGVRKFCDVVMGSEDCGALKPSILPFGMLAKELGEPCENILYVGNSIRSDVLGASRAGMKTAYVRSWWRRALNLDLAAADFSFGDYRQLQKFVLN